MSRSGTLHLLNSKEITLHRDESGVVWLQRLGQEDQMVDRAVPAFPLTKPDTFVTLFDEQGMEIGVIRTVRALDERSRKIIEEEIEQSYFMPEILEIRDVTEGLGLETWEVVTSKGERTFEVRSNRHDVRPVGGRRLLIKDVDGNRFDIRDWSKLDSSSQTLIEKYI